MSKRRTKYHQFRDANGKETITLAHLASILDVSVEKVRQLLRQEKKIPTDLHLWIKKQIAPGTREITELKRRQEVAETELKEEKLREIVFKNELAEGKYALVEDFQRELDSILIRLQTNLYAVPESVVDAIMTSRNRAEGKQVLMDALEHHMRDVSEWQIQLGEDDAETDI